MPNLEYNFCFGAFPQNSLIIGENGYMVFEGEAEVLKNSFDGERKTFYIFTTTAAMMTIVSLSSIQWPKES